MCGLVSTMQFIGNALNASIYDSGLAHQISLSNLVGEYALIKTTDEIIRHRRRLKLNATIMKLWQKDKASLQEVERFTVGRDQEMDLFLAKADVLGSLAHITMLQSIGLLTSQELTTLTAGLKDIHQSHYRRYLQDREGCRGYSFASRA